MTPWTIQSIEFSRPEYWSGQPFPSPGDLPGIEPRLPALQADSLPAEPQGKPLCFEDTDLKLYLKALLEKEKPNNKKYPKVIIVCLNQNSLLTKVYFHTSNSF